MKNKIGIIDTGIANIGSLESALVEIGANYMILNSKSKYSDTCSHLILPGVGSFDYGMQCLHETNLDKVITSAISIGKPILGICLGMQLLCKNSQESNKSSTGLSIFDLDDEDVVIRLTADNPIVDKHFLGLLRTSWENNNLDYLCAEPKDINKSMWPKGLSAEFIKVKNLKESYIKDKSSNNLEHVTPYVKNSNCKKVFGNEITDLNFKKKLFLGIDTFDDYLRLKNIFNDNIMTCYKEIINNLS